MKLKIKKRKIYALSIFSILLIFFAGAAYFNYKNISNKKETKSIIETKKQAEQNDVQIAKSEENKNIQTEEKNTQQTSPQPAGISVNISTSGLSGQSVYINALVNGATSGSCMLTMQNGSTIIEKKAEIGLQISYYICKGFTIPTSEFVPKGDWNAFITVNTPNGSAKSESRKVNVQ